MSRAKALIRRINEDESGHIAVGMPALVAAVGAIVLAIGASGDTDVLTIIGGIVLAVGVSEARLRATAASTTTFTSVGQAREVAVLRRPQPSITVRVPVIP